MPTRTVTVAAEVGLHAKPAGLIAAYVREVGLPVRLAMAADPETTIDAANPLQIMTLGASHGDEVVVTCSDITVLDHVAEIIETVVPDPPVVAQPRAAGEGTPHSATAAECAP